VEFDSQERWEAVAATDVCRRWWRHMSDVMPSTDEVRPISRTLDEVFHIEDSDPHYS
jgi:L-rhamnose mutarotase